MRSALCQFGEVFACLTPFERKELIRLVLRRAEVGDRQIVLELYGTLTPEMATAQSRLRSEPPNWLPGLVPQSVLRDVFTVRLPSLARRVRQFTRDRAVRGRKAIAGEWKVLLDRGVVVNRVPNLVPHGYVQG